MRYRPEAGYTGRGFQSTKEVLLLPVGEIDICFAIRHDKRTLRRARQFAEPCSCPWLQVKRQAVRQSDADANGRSRIRVETPPVRSSRSARDTGLQALEGQADWDYVLKTSFAIAFVLS